MNKELVFHTHPYSRGAVVHWMLEEIGTPYRIEILEFGAAMKAPSYLAINPMGKVPAITHGETVVTETGAILAYLADSFPEAGLAPASNQRGAYYRWLFFAAGCIDPAMTGHAQGWDPATPELQGQFGYGCYDLVMDTLAAHLDGRPYVAGQTFSAADIYVASMLRYGMTVGQIEPRPVFEAYCGGLTSRPAALRARKMGDDLIARRVWPKA